MDQMLEVSSDKLSTFIHWYYWSSSLGNLIILCISYAVMGYFQMQYKTAITTCWDLKSKWLAQEYFLLFVYS